MFTNSDEVIRPEDLSNSEVQGVPLLLPFASLITIIERGSSGM